MDLVFCITGNSRDIVFLFLRHFRARWGISGSAYRRDSADSWFCSARTAPTPGLRRDQALVPGLGPRPWSAPSHPARAESPDLFSLATPRRLRRRGRIVCSNSHRGNQSPHTSHPLT